MAQNNDSPGKRLKREEAKNTLYVNNPNDPRIQAYQDSLANYNYSMDRLKDFFKGKGRSENQAKQFASGFYDVQSRNRKVWEPLLTRPDVTKNTSRYAKENEKQVPDMAYDIGGDHHTVVIDGVRQPTQHGINPVVYLGYSKPKQPVEYKQPLVEEVEPLSPRQPSILAPSEIIAPVVRPVPQEKTPTERPVARKPPKAVMPRRAGGWSNQPLLMQLFPKLYER